MDMASLLAAQQLLAGSGGASLSASQQQQLVGKKSKTFSLLFIFSCNKWAAVCSSCQQPSSSNCSPGNLCPNIRSWSLSQPKINKIGPKKLKMTAKTKDWCWVKIAFIHFYGFGLCAPSIFSPYRHKSDADHPLKLCLTEMSTGTM